MLAERKAFHAFLRPLFRKDWVVGSMPNGLSEDPSMSSNIWPATHIVSPFPITGS